jgi:hypothetical protein
MSEKEEIKKRLIDNYVAFGRKFSGNNKWKPNLRSEHNQKIVEGFVEELYKGGTFGDETIQDFLFFSFGRKLKSEFNFHGGKKPAVVLNHILSKKVLKAYYTSNPNQIFVFKNLLLSRNKEVELKLSKQKGVKHKKIALSINGANEKEKERLLNTVRGYVNCADMTTLFHPRSVFCQMCKYKEECKKRLKLNYEKIYEYRMNG